MMRSKFSDSQIIDAVKRVESGIGVPDICHESGVSTATLSEVSVCDTNKGT
jgi:putative transposase